MLRIASLLKLSLVLMCLWLTACGGSAEGDQSDLLVCSGYEVILPNGQCGIPPPVECELPEILVDGACIVPDDPEPVYKPATGEAVIYFNRRDKNFDGWVLHLWDGCSSPSRGSWDGPNLSASYTYSGAGTTWPDGPTPNHAEFEGLDPIYGAYWVLNLQDNPDCGNYIIHNLDGSVQTSDLAINYSDDPNNPYANMSWVVVDNASAEADMRQATTASSPICLNDICQEFEPPPLIVENYSAHWIDADTLVWDRDLMNVTLYAAPTGGMDVDSQGNITGAQTSVSLTSTSLTTTQQEANPHLAGYAAYAIDVEDSVVKTLLKQQLILVGEDSGASLFGTQVQTARALDAVYTQAEADADEAALGPVYDGGNIRVSLWAPTAQNVQLRVFDRNNFSASLTLLETVPMTEDTATGIWSASASASDWDRKYYRFRVTVFNPYTGENQSFEVQDPYSVSAYFNGTHSQFVDLNDDDLKPAGWDGHAVPTVSNPESAFVYEGHVRDFSIRDESTSEANRGKYLAFTESETAPMQHLQALQQAGLTHFHILPSFDFASVDENPFEQINLQSTVFELCEAVRPDVPEVCDGRESNVATLEEVFASYREDDSDARDLVAVIRDLDGFNWGYDPVLFNVPEGSYASDPRGEYRVLEMRSMVKALHDMGLRVVMDVVYNHTSDSGVASAKAIFDKIVPGYYFRRDVITGKVENASCCNDTASEHAMFAKLVEDSLVLWSTQYGIDSYRFDVMSLMPKQLITDALATVQTVDPDTYFYGEGWNTSQSTADDALFERATQANMVGTGVGTFNDRMRDQMRFLNLFKGDEVNRLRTGLAGNLAEFQLQTRNGTSIKASSDGGYTVDPQESVNYVEKHDNETLWDWLHQAENLPEDSTLAERVRMQNMTQSMVLFSQGVPFVHMGSDILRSKSMDGNSYNSGDWFNTLDFTLQHNNFAVGLPPTEGNNASDADVIAAFRDSEALPQSDDIVFANAVFKEWLQISSASPLFSLTTEQEVLDRVGFHNMGAIEVPGIIVMSIDDGVGTVTGTEDTARADLDPTVDAMVVVFNGTNESITHFVNTSTGFTLHSVQQNSVDAAVQSASFSEASGEETGGSFSVPAYTTAVFVKAQSGAQAAGLSAYATSGFEPPVPYGDTQVYVRGAMNGWSTDDELLYVGSGVYETFITIDAGDYEFKVASEDWSTVDLSSADGADVAVTLGEDKLLGPGFGIPNLTLSIATAGEYKFSLNAIDGTNPTLTVSNAQTYSVPVFVRGTLNDWSTDDELAYVGRSIYQVTIPGLNAEEYEFKLASEDWSTVDLSTADASNVVVNEGEAKQLGFGGGIPNMTFTPSAVGDYLFTLAAADPDNPVLTVVNADPWNGTAVYVRGAMNGWGVTDQLSFVGAATYSIELALTEGSYEFKVASEDWSTVNLGADDNATVTVGLNVLLLQDSQTNFTAEIPADGTYRFEVDASGAQPVLTVTAVATP